MNRTSIEWTDFTANPLKYRDAAGNVVWGCVHTSPGCRHCYSETLAKRYGRGGPFSAPVMTGLTPFLDENELHKMRTSKVIGGKAVSGSRCFIGDMTDLFGDWVPDDLLNRLFSQTLELRTDVTWQILTKRAGRAHRYFSWRWGGRRIPSRHIHLGVSIENQPFADERVLLLLQTPAAVRFISAEPLLAAVDVEPFVGAGWRCACGWHDEDETGPSFTMTTDDRAFCPDCMEPNRWLPSLDWVIVGGESGAGARPFDLAWARAIVQQCKAAGVPVFVKQLGAMPIAGRMPHPDDMFLRLKSRKGGDMAEWPEDLRIREFPKETN